MASITFCCDDETGETITYSVNQETGEPVLEQYRAMQDRTSHIQVTKRSAHFPRGHITKSKKFQLLKANIIRGSNTISHRLLLIPAVMIFPDLFCILLMVLEIYLHVRCHKKNKILKDPTVYYRSPFHMLTSAFCGVCRENDTASRVGQLQDQRRDRYDCLRGMAL